LSFVVDLVSNEVAGKLLPLLWRAGDDDRMQRLGPAACILDGFAMRRRWLSGWRAWRSRWTKEEEGAS